MNSQYTCNLCSLIQYNISTVYMWQKILHISSKLLILTAGYNLITTVTLSRAGSTSEYFKTFPISNNPTKCFQIPRFRYLVLYYLITYFPLLRTAVTVTVEKVSMLESICCFAGADILVGSFVAFQDIAHILIHLDYELDLFIYVFENIELFLHKSSLKLFFFNMLYKGGGGEFLEEYQNVRK